jgi:hypothetical protein
MHRVTLHPPLAAILSGLSAVLASSGRTLAAQETAWPFEPGEDPFDDSTLLDLRSLNEKEAG